MKTPHPHLCNLIASHTKPVAPLVHLACMNSSTPRLYYLLGSSGSPNLCKTPRWDFAGVLDGCSFFFPRVFCCLPWLYIFVPASHTKPTKLIDLHYCISNATTLVRPRYCPKSVSHPSFWKLVSSTYSGFILVFQLWQKLCLGQLRHISWSTPRQKSWARALWRLAEDVSV